MISAVVVFHSGLDDLRESVRSLSAQVGELVVVDVSPGSIAAQSADLGAVEVVRCPENKGYGWACNIGVQRSTGDPVLVSNPDVFYQEGAVAALAEVADGGALCAPVQYRGAVRTSCAGESLQLGISLPAAVDRWIGIGRRGRVAARRAVLEAPGTRPLVLPSRMTLSGASLMASKATWAALKGFDERFFLYQEDADLCERARRLGVPVVLVRDARVLHDSGTGRRGQNITTLRWAMQSEYRAWAVRSRPVAMLGTVQAAGIVARLMMSAVRRRPAETRLWLDALREVRFR